MKTLTIPEVIARTNLKIPVDQMGKILAEQFQLGKYKSCVPLLVGYEEMNCFLQTNAGTFVVKVFSKEKYLKSIQGNADVLEFLYASGIPVSKLYQDSSGISLHKIQKNPDVYLIVMDYFGGYKFTEIEPTFDDMSVLIKYLAKVHTLSFHTYAHYDSWLAVYFPDEYSQKSNVLTSDEMKLLYPVVMKQKQINYSKLSKSVVHFDLHRENAMKNNKGEFCILDWACCDMSYSVIDLATFLGLFCLDGGKSVEYNRKLLNDLVSAYISYRKLSEYELSVLPDFIRSIYASNVLIPIYLQKTNTDENPKQSQYYKNLGLRGLELMKKL